MHTADAGFFIFRDRHCFCKVLKDLISQKVKIFRKWNSIKMKRKKIS